MKKTINFELEDAKLIDENPDSQFATAKLTLFSTGPNRHNMTCDLETLKRTASSSYEKPIVFGVDNRTGDFYTHDPNNIPAGFIVPNSAEFVEQPDGRTSLVTSAKVWRAYSGKFIELFKRNRKTKAGLSVEMDLLDWDEDDESGLTRMKDFVYNAAAILGSVFTEASPGANIQMLSFSEEYQKDYESEFGSKKYPNIDFTIPEEVKASAKKGLAYHKKLGGATSVGISTAKYLLENESITPAKFIHVAEYFSEHKNDEIDYDNPTSKSLIAWNMWGGDFGLEWSNKLSEKIKKADEEKNMTKAKKDFDNGEVAMEEEKDKEEMATEPKDEEMAKDEEVKEEMAEEKPAEEMAADEPAESDEEEKKEEDEEEKKEADMSAEEPKDEEFSNDSYLDVAAMLAFLKNETEEYKVMADRFQTAVDVGMAYSGAVEYLFNHVKELTSENEALKSFKADVEAKEFSIEVESTIQEVAQFMSKDDVEAMRESSKEFSLENIDAWKNSAKAKAFALAKEHKTPTESTFKRAGLPWASKKQGNGSPWK